jgi:hypothetical protein
MKKNIYRKILSILLCLPLLGCSNIFQGLSNKTTDEALFEDVQTLMDEQNWDDAITKLNLLSSEFKTRHDVIETWAGVYAGKCGLNFIDYFTSLGSASLTGTTIFAYFMRAWTGKTVDPDSCTLAQTKMEEISTDPAERTSGQNLFLAVLGMVKIGVYLRAYADRNGAGNLGDGTAEINVCTNDANNLLDAKLDEVITGLGLVTTNIAYLTAVLSNNSISGALDALNTACQASPGACGKTNPADISPADRGLFRDLLKTGPANPTAPMGIDTCNDVGVVTCC